MNDPDAEETPSVSTPEEAADAPLGPPPTSLRAKLTSAAFALGALALLGWVLHRNGGVRTILLVVDRLKTTWPWLLVAYSLAALVVLLGYRAALPDGGRAVPIRTLLRIERAGSALNTFMPLGDSSGNIAKIALLRHWYTSEQIVAAGVWSSLATGLGNAVAALGPLVGYATGMLPWPVAAAVAALNVAMAIPAVAILLLVRKGLAARVGALVGRIRVAAVQGRREAIVAWARRLDLHLASAVHERRGDFLVVFAWKCAYQVARVGQFWLMIELLGLRGGVVAALVYNAMTRSVQQIFVFVPGRIGVMEGLSGALFAAIGWPRTDGIEMALALRFNFIVNVLFSGTALSGSHALARAYPPRTADEIARDPSGLSGTP